MHKHHLLMLALISVSFGVFLSPGEETSFGGSYSAVLEKVSGSYAFLEVGCSGDVISELSVKEGRTHKINHGGSSISVEASEVSSEGADIDFSVLEKKQKHVEACSGKTLEPGESLDVGCFSISLEKIRGSYAYFSVYKNDEFFSEASVKTGRGWGKEKEGSSVEFSTCENPSCENCAILYDYEFRGCALEVPQKELSINFNIPDFEAEDRGRFGHKGSSGSGSSGSKKESPENIPEPPEFEKGTVLYDGDYFEIDDYYSLMVSSFAYANSVQMAVVEDGLEKSYFYLSFNTSREVSIGNKALNVSSEGGSVLGGWIHVDAGNFSCESSDCSVFKIKESVELDKDSEITLVSFVGPYAYFTLSRNGFSYETFAVPEGSGKTMEDFEIFVCSTEPENRRVFAKLKTG